MRQKESIFRSHVGRFDTFSLPVHHSTQHCLDRATFSKTTLYTDNHFRKNLFNLFQNNFLISPYEQTQSGGKTTLKNHSQILNMRVPETCTSTLLQKTLVQSCQERNMFGDSITADHKVLSEGCDSRHNHRYAVVVEDLAPQRIHSYPYKTKTSQEKEKKLAKVLGAK